MSWRRFRKFQKLSNIRKFWIIQEKSYKEWKFPVNRNFGYTSDVILPCGKLFSIFHCEFLESALGHTCSWSFWRLLIWTVMEELMSLSCVTFFRVHTRPLRTWISTVCSIRWTWIAEDLLRMVSERAFLNWLSWKLEFGLLNLRV